MTQIETRENKMGYLPVPRLLMEMSLPIILSMMVQALYNIVDSIFVSQISEDALTAVSLVFPIQNLMIAVGAGTGVGVNALLSRSLGAKQYEDANQAARNGIFVFLLSAIAFSILGITLAPVFLTIQTTDPEISLYGIQYMQIITGLSFALFMQILAERLLQSTGRAVFSMMTQGLGAIINIILDPIFIFGLFGFPRMEVTGAAFATIVGQTCAATLGLYLNLKKNPDINLNMRRFRPSVSIIKTIYSVGVPSIIMQSIGSVTTFGMNKILLMFTPTATAVYGVYFRLQSFIFMPIFGLNNGMIPIIAYNYGARNPKRIMKTIKLSISFAVSIMLLGLFIFQIFPVQLLSIFNASPEMVSIGVPALRIISICFIFAGYCIVVGSVFQALGNGVYTLINSIFRQLVFLLPLSYVFAVTVGLNAVWWSTPLAEISSVVITTIYFVRIYRDKVKPLY